MPTTTEKLMTANEFLAKYGHCSGVELVNGRVVWEGREADERTEIAMPKFRHGVITNRAATILTQFVDAHSLGWVASNDTFVRTADGESVRGADVLYISFARLPKEQPIPEDLTLPPDLVVEVRSPSETWNTVFAKVVEYLTAGVRVVLVLDASTLTATVYRNDTLQQIFHASDELTIPDVLPGFAVKVSRFFE